MSHDHVTAGAVAGLYATLCRHGVSQSERQFLPDAKDLTDSLLLVDAGYIDRA